MEPRRIHTSPHPKISRYNGTGAAIAAGRAVMADPNVDDGVKYPASADSPIFGVTENEIADKTWGDVIVAPGVVPIENDGGVARGALLGVDTSGRAVTWSASAGTNKSVLGTSMRTAADGAVDEVLWVGPGVSRQG